MNENQAREIIEAIITAPTVSLAVEYAWANRQLLLSPTCFRVLMSMLQEEHEQQRNSKRYEALLHLKHYRTALSQARLQDLEHDDESATTLPELTVVSTTITVEDVIRLFKSGDITARKAFFAELSPSHLATETVFSPHLDLALISLNLWVDPCCRGGDIELGMILSKAAYQLSQQLFDTNQNRNFLTTAEGAAHNYAIALMASGQHTEALQFTSEAIQWLEARESKDVIAELLLDQVEAHINLAQVNVKQTDQSHFDQAEVLLKQTDWDALIPENRPSDRQRKADLEKDLNKIKGSVIVLPQEEVESVKIVKQYRRDILEKIQSIAAIAPEEFAEPLKFLEQMIPQNIPDSLEEWVIQTQPVKDALTQILSGEDPKNVINRYYGDARSDYQATQLNEPVHNRHQLKQRITNASQTFFAKQQSSSETVEQAGLILIDALKWAREHRFAEEESSALWGLYLYYNRTAQYSQAVKALKTLWANLEVIRSRIANPLERAGVMAQFPNLFSSLCRSLHQLDRPAELLQAIEGGKGRYLADVLLKQTNQLEQDPSFSIPTQFFDKLKEQRNAHYLTYFVSDEETYAVLIAKDGTFHIPNEPIPLGKTQLQEWLRYDKKNENHNPLNPKNWGSFISQKGHVIKRVVKDLPNRLAPLVSWLEALVEKSILQQNDHLCYCPDAQLHLIPLHYIPFRGEPLVKFFSVSRIHGAAALTAILNRKPLRPAQYTAVRISAQSDRDLELKNIEQKLAAFRRVPEWLKQSRLTGQTVAEEDADLPTVTTLPFKQRLVHFATHGIFPDTDNENREVNPYENSGLLLAQHGQLPMNKEGIDTSLLTPQQVFDRKLDFWGSHITLSACVSGLAKEGIGGDALGLEWALLQAGATSLLATHWNVNGEWVAEFSEMFYQKWLFEGVSRAVAWRESVLELMKKNSAAKHPEYYWAAFSLSGDWR